MQTKKKYLGIQVLFSVFFLAFYFNRNLQFRHLLQWLVFPPGQNSARIVKMVFSWNKNALSFLIITVRNNLALSVFFVRLDGVSCWVPVTFKPVPFRASSLGNPLSTTAVRLVAALLLQLDSEEAPILLSMPKIRRILLLTLHNHFYCFYSKKNFRQNRIYY